MIETWRKLWPEVRPYRGRVILVLVLGVLTSGLKGLIPELVNRLFSAWQTGEQQLAWIIPPVLAAIWIFASITRFYHLFVMKFTADRVAVGMRKKLMDKYLSLNLSFFQDFERGSGGLISRMINDITTIQTGIHKVADLFREPVMVFFMLGYLLYLDWKLTVMVLVALPIVTAVLRRLARSLRKYSKQNQEIMEELTRTLKESLDGTRIVQSFGLEQTMRDKFERQAEKFLATRKKIVAREEAAGPISESLTSAFISVLLLYIGYQVFRNEFTLANFMSFMFAMGLLQDAIRKLQDGYIKLQQSGVALDRFHDILSQNPTVTDPADPKPFPSDWKEIEFRNVSFAYGDELVLRDINLTIRRSERIAFVGSSGSGKSTLVNLLQRFFDPTSGEILIGGVPIKDMRLSDLRRNIALVSQDVFLFNDSIQKNIEMGSVQSGRGDVREAARLANAEDFINRTPLGYETNVGDFGGRISGGEKQRISIARAILKDSPILVLDEATSALDSESEMEVQKGLEELMSGRTALVIAHRLSTIASSDRILVLKAGRLVEEGTHHQLIEQQGEYFKFYQISSR